MVLPQETRIVQRTGISSLRKNRSQPFQEGWTFLETRTSRKGTCHLYDDSEPLLSCHGVPELLRHDFYLDCSLNPHVERDAIAKPCFAEETHTR